jgi:DNA-binding MarR family transcriptional regulator
MDPVHRPARNLSPEECAVAFALQEGGRTQTDIAQRLRVSQSAISRGFNRFRERGTHQRRHGQGRRRITTPRQDRFMRLRTSSQTTVCDQHFNATRIF